ncbi:VOC family protein [Nocardioides panacisoli]|uniref:VOC family protein n=1 Tax=Nocardioides panacisoli TaxID=627624 RepID=UPI001C6266D6|nr:VOC family protein [Nocardioides panacisoli]QYJ03315.1 VOC family protein [Nocardioides panacisoli]
MTASLSPKLVLADTAAALQWYADTLGAEVDQRYVAGDSIVFASMQLFGATVTLKDGDAHDPVPSPGPILELTVDDPDDLVHRMLDAGAETVFPVADQPYGARGGRVRDPHGVQWLVQTPLWLTPDQVQAAIDAMGG